jgi:hypothetical protein
MKSSIVKHKLLNRAGWEYPHSPFTTNIFSAYYTKVNLPHKRVDDGLVLFGFIYWYYLTLRRKLGLYR